MGELTLTMATEGLTVYIQPDNSATHATIDGTSNNERFLIITSDFPGSLHIMGITIQEFTEV